MVLVSMPRSSVKLLGLSIFHAVLILIKLRGFDIWFLMEARNELLVKISPNLVKCVKVVYLDFYSITVLYMPWLYFRSNSVTGAPMSNLASAFSAHPWIDVKKRC